MKREILKINNNCWTNWIKIINLNLITVHKAKITKITTQNQQHYITTTIDYSIAGTYLYENKSEPVVILNLDGTGIFQNQDLSKKEIM